MNELIINGIETIGDMKFHKIEGGFGKDKRALLVKEIAQIHKREVFKINQLINDNRKRFIDGVDIIDLKDTNFAILLKDSGIYTQNAINASTNIYALSERGYAKLLKILEDDVAWERHDQIVDGYFHMRETIRNTPEALDMDNHMRAQAMLLNAKNRVFKTIMSTIEDKHLSPIAIEVFGLTALEQLTGKPTNYRPECERTYTAGEVGAIIGGISSNMIGKTANKAGIKTEQYGAWVMDKSAYSSKEVSSFRYNQVGVDKLRELLTKQS